MYGFLLQLEKPDDFVIATGHMHSVREFVEASFRHGTTLVGILFFINTPFVKCEVHLLFILNCFLNR